ncbi:hypothetical protein DSC45_14325 [Streptomyces sp. YIM 130001]|uniref:DUF4097 family beta strand repeat-containing protein n=1 Tax=Streptomyces sp. YIM 130001 TaxID=2259644 RepID=UPI000E65D8EC|nr:DUF4097 family beta strand repeat-containing protein [Streptomyces sp. YIM 130001]RII17335.1 hypothetical protein DSC45_14325 [Streptomyces sp. YIM 130001]
MSSHAAGGRRRRYAVAFGGVVAVALLAGGCADAESDDEPETRSFGLEGRTLKVDSNDSAIELVAADGEKSGGAGRVEVTRWFAGRTVLGGQAGVEWELTGDTLKLRTKCQGVAVSCAARHRIEVPRGVQVDVVNGDGSVSAKKIAAPLRIRAHDGSVTVLDSKGPLDLHSRDGRVEAKGVTSRQVTARSDDGRVDLGLTGVPDRVEARSADGSVTVEVPRGTYRVDADSGDGSVDVSVPRNAGSRHAVAAHSDDGSVTVRER